jgi:outer membrane protein TolC
MPADDARRRLADLEAESQLDQLRADVVQAMQDGITSGKLIPISAQQLKSAEESLRQISASFAVGRAIQLDVLDAQSTLAQSRLRYAQAIVRFNQSQVRVLGSLGLLTAESLSSGPTSLANAPGAIAIRRVPRLVLGRCGVAIPWEETTDGR